MLTVKQIKEQLKDHNLRAVARATGIHENTLYSFMKSDNPRSGTAEKLSEYLEGKPSSEANE